MLLTYIHIFITYISWYGNIKPAQSWTSMSYEILKIGLFCMLKPFCSLNENNITKKQKHEQKV